MVQDNLSRQETVDAGAGDIELGYSDAIQKHFSRHVVQRKPISQARLDFERSRPRWLRECMAEATGVFFYVYPGIASTASFILNANNPEQHEITSAWSSFMQIGLAYGIGIAFAIIVCAPTSGGHFNPAITISLAFWQGFPWKKVPYFIFSQIFGSFIAGLMLMGQYHQQITNFNAASIAEGLGSVYNPGPAAILVPLPTAEQTNLGYLFLIEFFVDTFIALVIWASLDPANPFVSPSSAPYTIGLVYTIMVWGFAPITISTNTARDLGCRIVAAIFFGGEAFTYRNYSWIAILVNIPATLCATAYYEFLMRDSLQKIGKGHAVHEHGDAGLQRHLTNTGVIMEDGMTMASQKPNMNDMNGKADEVY